MMNVARLLIVLNIGVVIACANAAPPARLSSAEVLAITNGVRAFAFAVADDVTRRGPAAWQTHFATTPDFFMASEGRMVFDNGEAATRGIQQLTKIITRIELRWGDPLRVDPLTPKLAMVAAPYRELRTDSGGLQVEENGYFTGLAELTTAGWQFRNAHWSVVTAPSPVP